MGGYIQVQSSQFGADYLESRINVFLESLKIKGGFDQEQVMNVQQSLIQQMKQVHTNLNDEANEDWKSIKNENYKFNSK